MTKEHSAAKTATSRFLFGVGGGSVLPLFLALGVLCHIDKAFGPHGFVDFYDTVEVHFSHFQRMAMLWREYGPFSWYPFHAGGVPSFVGQHPPYHPFVFFSHLMPIWALSWLFNVFQVVVAGWGMTRLLSRMFSIRASVAIFCGTLFALSFVNNNVHIVFAYAFPAFAVWTHEALDASCSILVRVVACLWLIFVSLISYPVLTLPHFPVFHFALVLFLMRGERNYKMHLLIVFLIWTGYVFLFTPLIISLYEYIPYAQRNWNFPQVAFSQALYSLFVTIKNRLVELPVFPLLLPSILLCFRNRIVRTSTYILLSSLFVAGIFGSDMKNFLANTFVVKMDLFLSSMLAGTVSLLIVSAAFSMLLRERKFFARFVVLGLISLALRKGEYAIISGLFVLVAGLCLIMLINQDTRKSFILDYRACICIFAFCLVGFALMNRQSYMASGTYIPASALHRLKSLEALSQTPGAPFIRVACLDVHPAVVQSYGLDTVGGKSPLFNKYYKEYVQQVIAPQLNSNELRQGYGDVWRQMYLTRSKADHDQRPLVLNGPQRSLDDLDFKLLKAMGVEYIISAKPLLAIEGRAELMASDSLPKSVFLPPIAPALADPSASMRIFLYRVLHPSHAFRLSSASGATDASVGDVTLTQWSPDRLVFQVNAAAPARLTVANNFDPRWTASVDGRPATVMRSDLAFQAVDMDRTGAFRVELVFHSPIVWWLHLASLFGMGLFFVPLTHRRATSQALTQESWVPHPVPWSRLRLACLLSAVASVTVWTMGYLLFVVPRLKVGDPRALTMAYALVSIPLLGLGVGAWASMLFEYLGFDQARSNNPASDA